MAVGEAFAHGAPLAEKGRRSPTLVDGNPKVTTVYKRPRTAKTGWRAGVQSREKAVQLNQKEHTEPRKRPDLYTESYSEASAKAMGSSADKRSFYLWVICRDLNCFEEYKLKY